MPRIYKNAWQPWEDIYLAKGLELGLMAKEIKERFFKYSDRNVKAITSRLYKLKQRGHRKTPEEARGLGRLYFDMPKPHELPNKNYKHHGDSATHILGHTIYVL